MSYETNFESVIYHFDSLGTKMREDLLTAFKFIMIKSSWLKHSILILATVALGEAD